RSRWLTGEIYVDKGLENALNLDRDSFNRFHPEYRVVQDYVHQTLSKHIFPEVYKQIDARTKEKNTSRNKGREKLFRSVVTDILKTPIVVKKGNEGFATATSKKSGKMEIIMPA